MIEEKLDLLLIWLGFLVTICTLAFAMQIEHFRASRVVAFTPSAVVYILSIIAAIFGFALCFPVSLKPFVLALVFLVPFLIKKSRNMPWVG